MKISLISSSTRPDRNSHRVTLALKSLLESKNISVNEIDLLEMPLPLFHERFSLLPEENKTETMKSISSMLLESTGIIMITPEYNGGISPALVNLIDTFGRAELGGKPIAVAAVSTGIMGGMRAAQQLQQIILNNQAYPQPQLLLTGEVTKQLNKNGEIINPEYQPKMENFVHAFLKFAAKFE